MVKWEGSFRGLRPLLCALGAPWGDVDYHHLGAQLHAKPVRLGPHCLRSHPEHQGGALRGEEPQGGKRRARDSLCALSRSVDTDEDRYPQKLAFAECLCRGCIDPRTGRETAALNSVRLLQSLLVLRRRPCSRDGSGLPTPGAFAFHTEFIRVPVGCTCVLPRSV